MRASRTIRLYPPAWIGGSIGVQQILPRTGTSWQGQNPAPVQADNSPADMGGSPEPDRGATPDGLGKIVDKIV